MTSSRFSTAACLTLLAGLLMLFGTSPAHAQERSADEPRVSPNAEVHQTIGTTEVRVTYGRPAVRDRTIFGNLVPYDEIWRTGANEATTITFSDPVQFEGEDVEAGTYALFTIPSEESAWTVILNEEANQWGAYDHNDAYDRVRIDVEPYQTDTFQEQMLFSFEAVDDTSATLLLHWSETALPLSLTVPNDAE